MVIEIGSHRQKLSLVVLLGIGLNEEHRTLARQIDHDVSLIIPTESECFTQPQT